MSALRLRPADVHLYELCDRLSGVLIYFSAIFAPWAFGTTQPWSMWTLNVVGFILGFLLAAKVFIRRAKGYSVPRWDETRSGDSSQAVLWLTRFLVILSTVLLAYILIAALNRRAVFNRGELRFDYFDCISWLPHSLDAGRTWFWWWKYLALGCFFWAVRDWLLGISQREVRLIHRPEAAHRHRVFPDRLCALLWILSINGGILALEGIAQRVEGSGKLLFLVRPRINPDAASQFGPFAYRANAAAYVNLLWPVSLGFWWTLSRHGNGTRRSVHVLLGCAVIMAASAVISSSRGGALVSVCLAVIGAAFLLFSDLALNRQKRRTPHLTRMIIVFLIAALAVGYAFGWKVLRTRLATVDVDLATREEMYRNAWPMARDYPIFGTGPGTFESVFQLYRISTATYWPAQLHNDWLETRITFGIVGSTLIALAFAAVLLRWFIPGGIYGGRRFVAMIWLAIAGCLVHARYDFPFQVYSILLCFLYLCAILVVISRHPRTA